MLHRHQLRVNVPVKVSLVSAGAMTALVRLATELDVAGQINRALSGGGEVQVRAGLTVGESLVTAMIARACAPRAARISVRICRSAGVTSRAGTISGRWVWLLL